MRAPTIPAGVGRSRVLAVIGRRVRERPFWNTQAAIALITALHFFVESGGLDDVVGHETLSFHHVPVVLYLLPVAYASLVYGWEGALLTGAWAGTLAMSAVPFWHADNFDWAFELLFVVVVMGVGAVMARPVELERKQRREAERSARRLAILNDLASQPLVSVVAMTDGLARRLLGELPIQAVRVSIADATSSETVVEAVDPPETSSWSRSAYMVSFETQRLGVSALFEPSRGGPLSQVDKEFAESAVRQLAVLVENARLSELERATMGRYVRLVTEAQESERMRISRDLHDGPAQDLALLVRALDEPPEPQDQGRLKQRASDILEQIRRTARQQRPSALDLLGLRAALESTLEDLAAQDFSVSLDIAGIERRLPSAVEVSLYRIAQEAVRNAVEHSGGSHAHVMLRFFDDAVELAVEDDGGGFAPTDGLNAFVLEGHLGVMGMAERAELIGATFAIGASQTGGTSIVARWKPAAWDEQLP